MLECVINVSEGRSPAHLAALDAASGPGLIDRHTDADHNRSVFTLAGSSADVEDGARRLARAVVDTLDLAGHRGVHPRIGTLDVVPFVGLHLTPAGRLADGPIEAAVAARDSFAAWAADELGLPCFLYGPAPAGSDQHRTLPNLRANAWSALAPDFGPPRPHPRAGAAAVGARPVLVAYNLWLAGPTAGPSSPDARPTSPTTSPTAGPTAEPLAGPQEANPTLAAARAAAAAIRRPALRTLGLDVAGGAQVSCNLIDPWHLGPGAAHDLVAANLPPGVTIQRAELVGLLPAAVLEAEPRHRWLELGLAPDRTIEARLARAGLDGGSC